MTPPTGKSCFVFVFALRACVRASGGGGGARGIRVARVIIRGAAWPGRDETLLVDSRSNARRRRSTARSRNGQEDGWETARRQLGDS